MSRGSGFGVGDRSARTLPLRCRESKISGKTTAVLNLVGADPDFGRKGH